MKSIQVSIEGITPLLQHRFAMDGADDAGRKRTGVPDWKQEAEKAKYADEKGELYQPSEHLERAMAIAAAQFKVQGKRGATYSKLVGSTVEVYPFTIPHKHQEFQVDARPVVIQRSRVIRYRPRLDKWALDFELRLLDDQLPIDVVKQILDHAGIYVGIGDYRPDKKGKYGKFIVTRFEEVN